MRRSALNAKDRSGVHPPPTVCNVESAAKSGWIMAFVLLTALATIRYVHRPDIRLCAAFVFKLLSLKKILTREWNTPTQARVPPFGCSMCPQRSDNWRTIRFIFLMDFKPMVSSALVSDFVHPSEFLPTLQVSRLLFQHLSSLLLRSWRIWSLQAQAGFVERGWYSQRSILVRYTAKYKNK